MRQVVVACFVSLVLAGCGSDASTTPIPPLAAHFDSLTTVEYQKPVGSPFRYLALLTLANALAHGAVAIPVTINVNGQPTGFEVTGMQLADSALDYPRVTYVAGWADAEGQRLVIATFYQDDFYSWEAVAIEVMVGDSGAAGMQSPPTFAFKESEIGNACENFTIVNEAVGPNPLCRLAAATISFDGGGLSAPSTEFTMVQLTSTVAPPPLDSRLIVGVQDVAASGNRVQQPALAAGK